MNDQMILTDSQIAIWNSLISDPFAHHKRQIIMDRIAYGLSEMIGQPVVGDGWQVIKQPLTQLETCAGVAPETETVGVYLQIESGLHGWVILALPMDFALNLAASMMGNPHKRSQQLGRLERSALAEVGNLALSYFLNAVAALTDHPEILHPSPPAVIVDMMGALMTLIVTPVAANDDVVIIQTTFKVGEAAQFCMWVSPDLGGITFPMPS